MYRRTIILLLAVLLASSTHAAILRVDADAVPGGSGTSWPLAFTSLDDALAAAESGDELWIAAGTYIPAGTSFEIGADIALYGGFAGIEASREERDVDANPTILSGDVNGDDGPSFTNRDDNVGSLVLCLDGVASLTIDGFAIEGGNASRGGGVHAEMLTLTVRSCHFESNLASRGGGIHCVNAGLYVADCVFETNRAIGGAINVEGGTTMAVTRCAFSGNTSGTAGGAIRVSDLSGLLEIRESSFLGQQAGAGGGAVFVASGGDVVVDRCQIIGNTIGEGGASGGGLQLAGATETISNCIFIQNDGRLLGGGLATNGSATVVNSVFSRNSAQGGGGIYAGASPAGPVDSVTVINCSFSENTGGAIATATQKDPFVVRNSIIWRNVPDAFTRFPPGPLPDELAIVSDSIVQGGHPGSNNVDVDPLFRAPGIDDLRLTAGSPALDAGLNGYLPEGFDDVDLDGAPRIQNIAVDLGAYEGVAEDAPAPAVSDNDIDEGGSAILSPLADGLAFSPLEFAGVVAVNQSGGDNGAMTAAQPAEDPYPGAGGYRFLSDVLEVETTIVAGAFVARLSIPFDADDLNGLDPLELDVTVYDPTTNTWALAVSANVNDAAPIGTRYAVASESNPALNLVPGDYGVYWKPSEQRGFAWANVNHTSTFGVGVPRCRADVVQPPNGSIGFADLMAVLAAWGSGAGPTDVDFDGAVGLGDVTALVQAWGACRE